MDTRPGLVFANPMVRQANGMAAVRRGPLVYCLETADNPCNPLERISLEVGSRIYETKIKGLPGGTVGLKTRAVIHSLKGFSGKLYTTEPPARKEGDLVLVPFHLWDNRKKGSMRVWVRT